MPTGRNHFQFNHAVVEVVDALFADQPRHAALGRFLVRRGNVPTGEIARPNVDHLALADQAVEGLPGFVPGALTVDVMHLVEVDPFGLQAFEAAFAVFADLISRQATTVAVHLCQISFTLDRVVHFCGQNGGVPAFPIERKPAANDLFCMTMLYPATVDIGCIKEIDAEFERTIHDLVALFFAGVPAEVHGTQTQVADKHPMSS